MVDAKMTNILITTNQFLATIAYPVKNKTEQPISKKLTTFKESIDAVLEVTPIMHSSEHDESLARAFYDVISEEAGTFFTKKRKKELQLFLTVCGEKIHNEMKESLEKIHLKHLEGNAEAIFVNLLDKAGNLIESKKRSPRDILIAFKHLSIRLLLWKATKQKALAFLHDETEHSKHPHKEKTGRYEREGITRRYMPSMTRKVA